MSSPHLAGPQAAQEAFARLLERLDRDGAVDFEAEFAAAGPLESELRALHRGWVKLEGAVLDLRADNALESALWSACSMAAASGSDESALAFLEQLGSPERAARRYERIERIARGGMGEVWRVRDSDLDREVAMKVLRRRFRGASGRHAELQRRFLCEARLIARLDHPCILPLHDLGVDEEGRVWFTLPLVRGKSLAALLERPGVKSTLLLDVLARIAEGVAYAHSQGVVHRDIKPANVMVGPYGEAYLVDWGLAMLNSSLEEREGTSSGFEEGDTRHGDVLGTPGYMAPEQAEGRLEAMGPRADVYSLGAVLYHLLSGRPPHAEPAEAAQRAHAEIAGPVPLQQIAPAAAPELVAICEKAMQSDPQQRYAGAGDLALDLRAYLSGRVVRAHRTGAWPEFVAWTRRNRALAVSLCLALTLGLAALLAWSVQREKVAREILGLADIARLEDLESRAVMLGTARADRRPLFEVWLADAEALASRLAVHEQSLQSVRARARQGRGSDLSFASDEERWRNEVLAELVDGLRRLRDPDPRLGGIASVRRRLREAQAIERASLVDAADPWRGAIEEVADTARSPHYRGLRLTPQLGLVPLGRDPASGLFEFAHLESGVPPSRGPEGHLVPTPDSAIVLVLLPGGRFGMGADPFVEGGPPAADPWAGPEEGPRRTVELAPFFVAKYEVDQAQWERLSGSRPSWEGQGLHLEEAALLPVESVDWTIAREVLVRGGLALPTEAQWEYAARAGTSSRWWCGNEPGSLRGAVHGRSSGDPRLRSGIEDRVLPIDALRANPFGLHHVLGNVAEWTLDSWSEEPTLGLRPQDGLRIGPDAGLRALRGGSYVSGADELRCSARDRAQVELRDRRVGVRPVRPVEPGQ